MNVPYIAETAIKIISQNEIGLFLITGSEQDAINLDSMMDGYSIHWDIKDGRNATFYLRYQKIGSYVFDKTLIDTDLLKTVNEVTASFRLQDDSLEYVHPRPLSTLPHPDQQRADTI